MEKNLIWLIIFDLEQKKSASFQQSEHAIKGNSLFFPEIESIPKYNIRSLKLRSKTLQMDDFKCKFSMIN